MTQTPTSPSAGMEKMSATEATVSSFFAIAQEDLEASILLYNSKMYRPSVLLLQQAVEKAVKSLALQAGVIEPDGVRGLGHRPQKAYTDLIIQLSNNLTKSMKDIETREEMRITFALIGEDIRNVMGAVMEIKGKALRTAAAYDRCDISDEQVCDLLDTMDMMNQEFYELDEVIQAGLGKREFNAHLIKGTIAVKIVLFLIPMNPADKKVLSRQIDALIEKLPPLGVFLKVSSFSWFHRSPLHFPSSTYRCSPHPMRWRPAIPMPRKRRLIRWNSTPKKHHWLPTFWISCGLLDTPSTRWNGSILISLISRKLSGRHSPGEKDRPASPKTANRLSLEVRYHDRESG